MLLGTKQILQHQTTHSFDLDTKAIKRQTDRQTDTAKHNSHILCISET